MVTLGSSSDGSDGSISLTVGVRSAESVPVGSLVGVKESTTGRSSREREGKGKEFVVGSTGGAIKSKPPLVVSTSSLMGAVATWQVELLGFNARRHLDSEPRL